MNRTSTQIKGNALIAFRFFVVLLLTGLLLGACADDDSGSGALEIAGSYSDDFGTIHTIGESEWLMDFGEFGSASFSVLQFSNAGDFLVAQNGADNSFNADFFSRFDWTTFEDDLYFCQGTFDAATEAEAEAVDTMERTDPSSGGCGDFPWSKLTPQ